MLGESFQLMILDIGQQLSRELDSTQTRIDHAIFSIDETDLVIQETHVESGVMSDQDRIADEL